MADEKLKAPEQAVEKKEETLETKLKGKVSPEFDAEISGIVQRRAKLMTAFQVGLGDYLKTTINDCGIVTKPRDEFTDALTSAIYAAFGKAESMKEEDIKALNINAKWGSGQEPASALAYRALFGAMTGIDAEALSKRLKDADKLDYAGVQNLIMEPVVEASTEFLTGESTKKLLAADRGSGKIGKELKALFDIAGLKVKPDQMLVPEQRASLYKQVIPSVMNKYGAEYLPTN